MPLYRWGADNLDPVSPTTFEVESIQEADLRRLLRDQPEVLEDGLFIVAEEYSNWQDSSRSIDLLGLDESGRLVVIELKRTRSGDHSELQAIRYAAMVANMTLEQIVEAHTRYLIRRSIELDARAQVLEHLGVLDEADAVVQTDRPRIVLASAGFSNELTTSVLWLRDGGMDVSCVKLQLYHSGDGLLLDTSQVIPLPEAADYMVKVREGEERERRARRNSRATRIPGGDAFRDAIERARMEYKPMLKHLYEWVVSLEQGNLAILETRQGNVNTTLRASLPTVNECLAIIWQGGGVGSCQINRRFISRRAPNANARIEEILGPEGASNWTNPRSVPDGLLDALTDAYREANGLPPTTPPPGSGPGSPPMEEC